MRPVSLTLRGFIGINMGMGREEISIDLSGLDGLIAFDAPNGRGKSTLLENLQPYRRLASREGSLQHHVYLRDSYKEFTFDLAGHRYRTLVKIDAQSGRQEGFVWKDEEPQVSGKATEYDKYIEDLLGSPKLFFQSVFAAQNGDSLADMTTGELKGLFTEFLRLDKLAEYEETAKLAANAVKEKIDAIQSRVEAAEEKTAGLNRLQEELAGAEQNLSYKKIQAEEYRTAIAELQTALEKAKDAAADHRIALQQDAELDSRKKAIQEKLKDLRAKLAADHDQTAKEISEVKTQIQAKKAQLQERAQQDNLQSELKRLDMAVTDKEGDLEAVRKELDAAETEIEAMHKAWKQYHDSASKDLEAQTEHIGGLEQEKNDTEKKLSELSAEISRLENDTETVRLQSRVEQLQNTAAQLEQRDPECQSETCVFIQGALKAREELPLVQDEYERHAARIRAGIAEAGNRHEKLKAEMEELNQTIQSARERRRQLSDQISKKQKQHEREVAELARRRDRARKNSAEIAKALSGNKSRQSEIRRQLEEMPNYEVLESAMRNLETRLAETRRAWQQREEDYNKAIRELEDQVADINWQQLNLSLDYEAAEAVTEKSAEIENAQIKASELSESINRVQSHIAVLKHQISELAEVEDQAAEDRKKIEEFGRQLSQWRYIQQACGKDGLRALEIDGTAPLIAGYANDLLTTTFGPGATVGFRTINNDGRECLDVVVYREDDLDENGTLLENLSGGQKVWILKALRLALTLVAKEKSGKDIAVALSDEEDGALDAESARSFIEMYRAFLAAGGFESCLYITHRDSCKAMADHVIRLTDRGIKVDSSSAAMAA